MTTHLVLPRARTASAVLAVMVVLLSTLMTPAALSAPGSGDTKLLQGGVVVTANDPHLTGCTFTVQWTGFRVPPNTVAYRLEGAAPSGAGVVGTGTVTLDALGFGQTVISFTPANLALLTPHVSQGYHITLIGDSTDPNDNGKNKTFWIEKACGSTTGTLIIDKVATGTNASQTEPFAFSDNLTVGGSVGNVTADTDETFTVSAGTYSVTENNLSAAQTAAGWTKGTASCSDGSPVTAIAVAVGETVTCSYNNSFVAPATTGTLIIDKVATGVGASQTEPFAFTDDLTVGGSVGNVTADTDETFTVTAADSPFSVTEDALTAAQTAAGWTKGTASCDNGDPVTAINVGVGDTVTCTYNNSYVRPSGTLIINKVATGVGASQTEPFAFSDDLTVGGSVGNVTADTDETFPVSPGTYSVTENNLSAAQTLAGWTKGTASCSDGSPVTAIVVSNGETVTCTYNNSYVRPPTSGTLIIDKVATGTNASQTEPFAFSDNLGAVGPVGNVTPDTNETYTVTAGTYSVTEDALTAAQTAAGWTKGAATCSDGSPVTAIDVGVNETVTCTYNNSYTAPVIIIPPTLLPDLTVTKTGTPASIPVGGTATFTLTVSNVGAAAASNVVLTDSMPAGLSFVSSTPGAPTCSNVRDLLAGTDTMTCQLGTLAAGASTTVTVVATGTVAGTHINTAVVGPTDATPSNNTDTEDTEVTPVADVSVTKTVDDSTVTAGDQVTYTLTVTNNGPSDATGVVVTDTLPAELTFVSSDGACTGSSTITCTIGNLAAGATVVIHIVAETTEPGTFTNGVEVISTTADPDLANNSDEVDVEVAEVLGIIVRPVQPEVEPKPVVRAEQNVLPLTGAAILGLSGLGSALIMTGGLLLLFEKRRRPASYFAE